MKTTRQYTQYVAELDAQYEREKKREADRRDIFAAVFLGLSLAVALFMGWAA